MTRVLTIATAICGGSASHSVIEPLLADWQRELDAARARGPFRLALVSAAGTLALVRSMIACAIAEGIWLPPLRATALSILAIAFSLAVSIGVLLIAPLPAGMSHKPSDPLAQRWLLIMASTVVPPAFLLAMFMHRRDARATMRHAIVGVVFAAIATTAVVITTSPEALNRRYNTFEFQEQMRARMLEASKKDPDIWKGRSLQQTLATTVEQRRASYARMQARFAEWRKNDPPPTMAERFALVQPVLLAIVFAAMGWTLAGIDQPTISRGLIWWALVFLATIAMTNLLSLLVGVPMPRPPQWAMLPMFATIAAILIAAAKTRSSMLGGHS